MFDHLSLGVHDLDHSTTFYRRVLGALGYRLHHHRPTEAAFGPDDHAALVLYPVDRDRPATAPRMHVAFRAPDRAAVRAFHAAALALGGAALPDRDPAERPQFGADYFGAGVSDPDGHVLEVLTRAGPG
ncbi:MAG: VOC family protein [Myxococcota bacterium]